MTAAVALLRGVNVGGHRKMPMAELRGLAIDLGLEQVATYVQSGNLVFRTKAKVDARLARKVEAAIAERFGFTSEVILRTALEIRAVVEANPWAKRPAWDSAKLLVTFLREDPGGAARERVLALNGGPEELWISGRELFVYYPAGIGRAKLTPSKIDQALGKVVGTGRNWKSVLALLAMAEAP